MTEHSSLNREQRLVLAAEAHSKLLPNDEQPPQRYKRFAKPVVFFAGRCVLWGGPLFVAGYLANSRAGNTHWLSVASLPENPEERGGHKLFLSDRSAPRQPGEYPVHAATVLMRLPPDGEKHAIRVSVPLYRGALPSIDGWPLEPLESIFVNPAYEGNPPLPSVPDFHEPL